MAQITLTIPDAHMPRVIDALCTVGDYNADTDGNRGAFAKSVVIQWVRDTVLAVERTETERVALANAPAPEPLDTIT